MVVLTAMSASLYAAILIPFKVLPIIPGVTEFGRRTRCRWSARSCSARRARGVRPSAMSSATSSAASARAISSASAAICSTGCVPYKAWEALSDGDPVPRSVDRVAGVRQRRAAGERGVRPGHRLGHQSPGLRAVPRPRQCHPVQQPSSPIVLAPLLLVGHLPARQARAAAAIATFIAAPAQTARAVRRIGLLIVAVATAGRHDRRQLAVERLAAAPFLARYRHRHGHRRRGSRLGPPAVIVLLLIGVALL